MKKQYITNFELAHENFWEIRDSIKQLTLAKLSIQEQANFYKGLGFHSLEMKLDIMANELEKVIIQIRRERKNGMEWGELPPVPSKSK